MVHAEFQLGEVDVGIFLVLAKQSVTTISLWKAMLTESVLIPHVLYYCSKK